jgi:hypothetical protein
MLLSARLSNTLHRTIEEARLKVLWGPSTNHVRSVSYSKRNIVINTYAHISMERKGELLSTNWMMERSAEPARNYAVGGQRGHEVRRH